jgi:Cu(I)/Ag(I) efflux system membrane protein CusA/SilA
MPIHLDGKSDIIAPMAIPSFGGMTTVILSIFLVPVLYTIAAERRLGRRESAE